VSNFHKRRQFLINPNLQLKVSGWFIALAVVNIVIFYSCINYFFNIFYEKGVEIGLPKNHVFFMFIEDQVSHMNMIFIASSVITMVIILFAGILISHRIAGPMFRLTRQLNDLSESGDFKKVSFRNGDYFSEVADAFNQVVDKQNASGDRRESST